MTDRQTKAVAEAIGATLFTTHGFASSQPMEDVAQAAIEESDAKYVPMLVEALKEQARYLESLERQMLGATSLNLRLEQVLSQLPEDYRK